MGGRGSKITPVKAATLSSCLAYSHFCLFLYLKKHLASQKFHEDKEEKTKSLNVVCAVAEFYNIGIQKLTPRLG